MSARHDDPLRTYITRADRLHKQLRSPDAKAASAAAQRLLVLPRFGGLAARGLELDPDKVRRQDVLDVIAAEEGAADWRDFRSRASLAPAASGEMTSMGDVLLRRGLTLDRVLDGSFMPPSAVTVLSGGSPQGKSGLALQIARSMAESTGPVAFFTRESTAGDTIERLLGTEARLDLYAFRRRQREERAESWTGAREEGLERLRQAAARLKPLSFNVSSDDRSVEHVAESAERVRAQEGGLSLVVLDYVSLFAARRTQVVGNTEPVDVVRALAELATALQVRVLAVTPLQDRPLEEPNPRPELSHLGAWQPLGDAAASVVLIHRPNVHQRGGLAQNDPGPVDVTVAKHPEGQAHLSGTIIPSIRYVVPASFDAAHDWEADVHTWRPETV